MKKVNIPEELRKRLHEAAEKEDLKEFKTAIEENTEHLPDDLVYALNDENVIEEAMNLIGEGLASIEPDGIRLIFEEAGDIYPDRFH
jgi:hypothetical protein